MKKLAVSAAIAISLSLTACGASNASESTEAPATEPAATEVAKPQLYPAGPFELTSISGAEISFDLPAAADDAKLTDIEQFRTETGGEPITYLVVEVDNRNGSDPVTLETVSAFDAGGKKYEFTSVSDFINDWSPHYSEDYEYVLPDGSTIPEEQGDALYNRGVDLYNASIGEVAVAESSTVILASKDVSLPSEFTRVVVSPDAFVTEGEEATPAGSTTSN